jgi:hypothetical protein
MKNLVIALLLLWGQIMLSQNLVPNPYFSEIDTCNFATSNTLRFLYWKDTPPISNPIPSGFHICSQSANSSIPNNGVGYQEAKVGDGYVGLFASYPSASTTYRGYISVKLLDTLQQGITYYVSYYVSRAEGAGKAIATMGAYFSNSPLALSVSGMLLLTPHIENPANQPLTDDQNWMHITGSFIAQGGEQYITVGNFKNDTACGIVPVSGVSAGSYYFVDDVCVSANQNGCMADTSIGVKEVSFESKECKIYPNPTKDCLNIQFSTIGFVAGRFEISNSFGQVVLSSAFFEGDDYQHIKIDGLSEGVYVLRYRLADHSTGTLKFIVKREL